jgi:hypothetical protein
MSNETEKAKGLKDNEVGQSDVHPVVSHTLTYEDFIKWMIDEHSEIILLPLQCEYARYRFGGNFKMNTFSWPIAAGKTTIFKLIYQFTAECG